MPFTIKEFGNQVATSVLIPFGKSNYQEGIIRKYSALTYSPDINLGPKDISCFFHPTENIKIYVLGLGDEKDLPKSYLFFRSFIYQNRVKNDLKINVVCDHLTDDQLINAVIGLRKGLYNSGYFKTNGNKFIEPDITVILNKERHPIAIEALHTVEAQLSAMFLVDHPSNIKTPEFIGQFAREAGDTHGFDVNVIEAEELKKLGMDALLAVGQGSANPPVFIIMEYRPKGSKSKNPQLGLIGKGISFDTGGISIKPSANMGYMKCDMAGAAAVISALELAARLKLDIHLVGIVPSAENSVDANSIRPGDVIGSYSGKSIEVLDTDAEGRLVLADGLAYMIKNFKPDHMIDLATLTGSCVATLGYNAAGMFTNSDEMADLLSKVGETVNERVWRLPLWEEYFIDMNSDIADIKNLSGKPVSGAITAAKFLEYFTSEHKNWTHLDIAGVSFTDSEFAKTRTATGYGVRLLVNYMKALIKK
ncbi:MAG: leucyl aminopeptidase family protein [Saprospiraceae bacterium]|jgi:leucyl aminopeptidase|nr:leucyl aminopeptidase family protein [Saprospiraceae bacterium]